MVRSDSFERTRKGSKEPNKAARTKISSSPRDSSTSLQVPMQSSSSLSSVSQRRMKQPNSKKLEAKQTRASFPQPRSSSSHQQTHKATDMSTKKLSGRKDPRAKDASKIAIPSKTTNFSVEKGAMFGRAYFPEFARMHSSEHAREDSIVFSSRYNRTTKAVYRQQPLSRQQRKRPPQTPHPKETDTTSAGQTA